MIDRFVCFYCYLYLLCPLRGIFSYTDVHMFSEETRLLRKLLNESIYLKKVRPSNKVVVDIRFIFNQIISMVEKEQIIVTNCFVDQKWTGENDEREPMNVRTTSLSTDPRLVWNPSEFNNITWIRMPAMSIW